MKRFSSIVFVLLLLLAILIFTTAVQGQDYPTRTIEVIAGWGAGGGTDIFSRDITVPMSKILGVSMPVINMPGASSAGYGLYPKTASRWIYSICHYI